MRTVKIKMEQVSKTYSRGNRVYEALQNISLEVHHGEFLCLLGPSGCGKTTLLQLMAGFEKPSGGKVTVDGQELKAPSARYVTIFQDYGLFPWRNVLANVEYGLEVKGLPAPQRRMRAEDLIHFLGLEQFAFSYPHQLSGGMKQRVAIARALAVDPEIVFMDEPFSALDALTRLRMQEEIVRIRKEKQQTVVFVTHDISEAVFLADRIAIMSAHPGKISKVMTIPLNRPRHRTSPESVMIEEEIIAHFELIVREKHDYCI